MNEINPVEEESAVDLLEYYRLLMRHKWVILFSLVVMLALAVRYNANLTPLYRATATLIIDKETSKSPLTGQQWYYETYLSESMSFNTHFELITSRPVMTQVVRDLRLDEIDREKAARELAKVHPLRQFFNQIKANFTALFNQSRDLLPPPMDTTTQMAAAIKGMINIEEVEETRLLRIHVTSPSPERARDIANAVGRAYIKFNMSNRMASSENTLSWLTDQLYEMKKKLEDAEQDFLAYKQNVKLISVEDKQKIIAQKITDFNDAYLEARNKRMELDTRLEQLRRMAQADKDMPLLRSLIDNPLISQLHSQLVNAELEISRLGKVFKRKHPKIVQLQDQIVKTREKLKQEIDKEVQNLKAERAVLQAREQALQKTIADFENEGMEYNKKELQYSILKRNVEMNQNIYDALLVRLKEADIRENVDVSNIRIAEEAELPGGPMGPNHQRNLLLGAVLGLMIGVGIAFLWEYLERSLRTEEDVQKYLGLPVLGVIPVVDKSKHGISGGKSSASPSKAATESP